MFTGFTRAVLASGYRGPLSLEIFNDEFRAAPARLTARMGCARSYSWSGGGRPELPALPAFDGFEFLEFSVDEQSRQELAKFLKGLGFRHAGTHRSKDVQLYSHGQINLVLNAEQDSAAAEHFHLHGPSVSAMALRVDDAERAMQRARALLCPEWQERVGAGERHIPAVRAPDGTLFYLVQPDQSGPEHLGGRFFPASTQGRRRAGPDDHRSRGPGVAARSNGWLRVVLPFGFRSRARAALGAAGPVRLIRSRL